LAVEVIVIRVFQVETRYVPLEEITKLFDGDDIVATTNTEMKKSYELGKGTMTAIPVEAK
jgi:hypothetical protein